jgi:hypothetical protein
MSVWNLDGSVPRLLLVAIHEHQRRPAGSHYNIEARLEVRDQSGSAHAHHLLIVCYRYTRGLAPSHDDQLLRFAG